MELWESKSRGRLVRFQSKYFASRTTSLLTPEVPPRQEKQYQKGIGAAPEGKSSRCSSHTQLWARQAKTALLPRQGAPGAMSVCVCALWTCSHAVISLLPYFKWELLLWFSCFLSLPLLIIGHKYISYHVESHEPNTQRDINYSKTLDLKPNAGLPWWCSGLESACQRRGHGFEPWSGQIPHAAEELSPRGTTTKPALYSPWATATEPVSHNYWSPRT